MGLSRLIIFATFIGISIPALGAVDVPANAQARELQIATSAEEFPKLTGPQIQRIFSGLEDVEYPDENGSEKWNLSFQPDGSWEGYKTEGNEAEAYGNWRIDSDLACFSITGGYGYSDSTPMEGCFSVRIDRETVQSKRRFQNCRGNDSS